MEITCCFSEDSRTHTSQEFKSVISSSQGSVLSTVLFTIFVKDKFVGCRSENYKYADLTLLATKNSEHHSMKLWKEDINVLLEGFRSWQRDALLENTKVLEILSRRGLAMELPVDFHQLSGKVQPCKSVGTPGILIDPKLSFVEQIIVAAKKVNT